MDTLKGNQWVCWLDDWKLVKRMVIVIRDQIVSTMAAPSVGWSEGFLNGIWWGCKDGFRLGFIWGWRESRLIICFDGCLLGKTFGCLVGWFDGWTDIWLEGMLVGDPNGCWVGCEVEFEGLRVGCLDVCRVGCTVGLVDGCWVGWLDGCEERIISWL